jgi:hypothetical protein
MGSLPPVFRLLPTELHRHVRSCCYVRSGWRRLLPGHAASYGLEFETGVFRSFYGGAHGLADE